MKKYELHAHTSNCDIYAKCSGAEIVKLYADAGYSGIVITDHYFCHFTAWFGDQLVNADKSQLIKRYLNGYYSAKNEGEKIGFAVLPGAEVRFNGTINDYLVYGLNEEDFYTLPILNELNGLNELIDVLPDNALVVQAHPFRNNMTVCDPSPLFGIEVYNGATDDYRNQMAENFAIHYNKAMTSGSDFHSCHSLARGGIITESEINTPNDLISVLRCGKYSLIKTPKGK